MPITNDLSIPNDAILLRVLHESWVTNKGGRIRPASFCLLDETFENSCFISSQIALGELQKLFPGFAVAGIPAGVMRINGYVVERRPAECHPEYHGDPNDHVVVGPPEPGPRKEISRIARAIVQDPSIIMLRMLPRP